MPYEKVDDDKRNVGLVLRRRPDRLRDTRQRPKLKRLYFSVCNELSRCTLKMLTVVGK